MREMLGGRVWWKGAKEGEGWRDDASGWQTRGVAREKAKDEVGMIAFSARTSVSSRAW